MVEEDTIALVPDFRKKAGFGGRYRIGDKKRCCSLAPPPDPGGIEDDLLIESVRHIAKMVPVVRDSPFGTDGDDPGQGRTIQQRVHKVVVVLHSDLTNIHRGTSITRVYLDVF